MSTWMERFRFGTAHMWSAVMEPRGRRSIKSARKRGRAVEKPGWWKLWKTNPRFPTVPTAPWKSRKSGGIPTFPQLRRRLPISHPKQENPLRQAEGEQQGRSGEPDRSRVNKTGQIEKLTTRLDDTPGTPDNKIGLKNAQASRKSKWTPLSLAEE